MAIAIAAGSSAPGSPQAERVSSARSPAGDVAAASRGHAVASAPRRYGGGGSSVAPASPRAWSTVFTISNQPASCRIVRAPAPGSHPASTRRCHSTAAPTAVSTSAAVRQPGSSRPYGPRGQVADHGVSRAQAGEPAGLRHTNPATEQGMGPDGPRHPARPHQTVHGGTRGGERGTGQPEQGTDVAEGALGEQRQLLGPAVPRRAPGRRCRPVGCRSAGQRPGRLPRAPGGARASASASNTAAARSASARMRAARAAASEAMRAASASVPASSANTGASSAADSAGRSTARPRSCGTGNRGRAEPGEELPPLHGPPPRLHDPTPPGSARRGRPCRAKGPPAHGRWCQTDRTRKPGRPDSCWRTPPPSASTTTATIMPAATSGPDRQMGVVARRARPGERVRAAALNQSVA